MHRYLITQSLISSWAYMFDCRDESSAQAKEDFEKTLRREKSEPTEAMQQGIAFENAVYALALNQPRQAIPEWESGIQSVSELIRGALIQVKVSRLITIGGEEYLVYGILDALKAGTIYDIKFRTKAICPDSDESGNYDIYGKYLNSAQHPFYFYLVPEAVEFKYLVSDGEDLYIETYHPDECRSAESIIAEFISSISSMGYLEMYKEKWLAK